MKRLLWLLMLLAGTAAADITPSTDIARESSGNSSTTPLGSSATFTGDWEDVTSFATATISVYADQASAADGFKFQWSHGCSAVDLEETSSVLAATGRAFQISMRGKCFRVVYINGSVAQSTFRLGTVFRQHGSGLITRPLKKVLTGDNFAQTVHSIMAGRREDGSYQDLQVDEDGNLVITALTGFGADFSFGDILSTEGIEYAVRRTPYTEQTSNAQRSIVSSSTNDTAADTGARTVILEYLDDTGAGPFFETVTLNGTTPVNTVSTTICFIESIKVVTAGSGGVNSGILTLKAATAGGGATIGTIAAGNNQTFWAHHYVPTDKVANVTGILVSNDSTSVGNGAVFVMKSKPIGVADAVEIQVSDFVTLFGQSSATYRNYASPIKVAGPARLVVYVTPNNNTDQTQRASIDFFEP